MKLSLGFGCFCEIKLLSNVLWRRLVSETPRKAEGSETICKKCKKPKSYRKNTITI